MRYISGFWSFTRNSERVCDAQANPFKFSLAESRALLSGDFLLDPDSITSKVWLRLSYFWSSVNVFSGKALFIDTDGLPAPETKIGDFVQNEIEATIIEQVF